MSEVIWIPGIGNTETFDGAPIPSGGHLVSSGGTTSPPSSPVSVGIPPATATGGSSSSGSSGSSGGLYSPGVASSGGYTAPQQQAGGTTAPPNPAAVAAAQAMAARAAQKAANTVWANDPAIRAIEEQSWDIYVQTGSWSSPEQLALHQKAEDMRKALNPLYQGSGPGGPITQADENKISLPGVAPDSAIAKVAPIAALGIGLLLLLGLVKG